MAAVPRVRVGRPEPARVERVLRTIAREIDGLALPAVEKISAAQKHDPFKVLIATLLSARTQDATTLTASTRLFKRASTPRRVAALSVREIETLIYPVGFYKTKARHVKAACEQLVAEHGGRVPSSLEALVTLPGVGRKTASLVMIVAFRSTRHICVDIHVHRIANRLGWVRTETPEATEQALYTATDARWWADLNLFLVTWGQNTCRPVYPRCNDCAIAADCPRLGVTGIGHSRKGAS